MIPASPLTGIGITTKDRWEDLALTLTRLHQEGLDKSEIIVIDDGSREPVSSDFKKRFSWVRFIRHDKSEGWIVRRNELANLLSTEFYLSLDDDSYPVMGDFEIAAEWLAKQPSVAALAFRIIFPGEPLPRSDAMQEPFPIRDFIGCAFLVKRDLFLSLGSFEKLLGIYHEEPEYCFRTFQRGYDTYAYPAIVVCHHQSTIGRESSRKTRYFIRNVILLDLWFYPHPTSIIRAMGHLPSLFFHVPKLRRFWWALILGWLEGFYCYLKWHKLKQRLSRDQLAKWNARPVAMHACMGGKSPI